MPIIKAGTFGKEAATPTFPPQDEKTPKILDGEAPLLPLPLFPLA